MDNKAKAIYCIFDDLRHRILEFDFSELDRKRTRSLLLQLASLTIFVNEKYDKIYDERMKFIIHLVDTYTPESEDNDDLPFCHAHIHQEQGSK